MVPAHEIGVVGLATMGENLARNLASHGVRVAIYNRTHRRTDDFMAAHASEGDFRPGDRSVADKTDVVEQHS